jgi:sorting nexin-4
VIKEHAVFELSKKEEMKDMLQKYADGQVEMFQKVCVHSSQISSM